jgi:hypothetical protein
MKKVFIVPYRNRLHHKFFFSQQMTFLLEDTPEYEIYFAHQCDARPFNRGATKNIGFLAVREKYPDSYQDMTFIFNDVDTLPFHKIFDYDTTRGVVKHYYGFEYALGGIVVMKGADFEQINGFPNFWGWGNEDKVLQTRCQRFGLTIDRSEFYPIGSPEILQLFDGVNRLVAPRDYHLGNHDSGHDGVFSINRLTYSVDAESLNPADNQYVVTDDRIFVINILSFLTALASDRTKLYQYDLRDPVDKIVRPLANQSTNQRVVTTDDWKQIPAWGGGGDGSKPPPHVFSPEYARYIGAKPRASTSATIGFGGIK